MRYVQDTREASQYQFKASGNYRSLNIGLISSMTLIIAAVGVGIERRSHG
jgi:UDP-N-acetyl-D-mannosaminuronate dehydrogenase